MVRDLAWLLARVEVDSETDCWEWQKARTELGYGLYRYTLLSGERRMGGAHRLSYELHHQRPISPGMFVCHHCDNPPCCNPEHLFEGTSADNSQDRAAKGRTLGGAHSGELHPNALLTVGKVLAIREAADAGVDPTDLAKKFGVSRRAVTAVIRRENWKHV